MADRTWFFRALLWNLEDEVTDLFLSPHNDDETLFGAFTILRHNPHVIVCLKSVLQEARGTGITAVQRETETARALWWLGDPTWEQWQFSDMDPDWEALKTRLSRGSVGYRRVFAPAYEQDGHEQHNKISQIARHIFGEEKVETYLTYRRGHGRSVGTEVPYEASWPMKKLRALACYETQINEPSTAYWFMDSGLREYVP